jgi:hypothetical protein
MNDIGLADGLPSSGKTCKITVMKIIWKLNRFYNREISRLKDVLDFVFTQANARKLLIAGK